MADSRTMVNETQILDVLRTIDDPEMPISIVDLGIVEGVRVDGDRVAIDILPTFVGCPALPIIEETIKTKVADRCGTEHVDVRFKYDPPWTVDRISEAGRESLRKFGITTPREKVCASEREQPPVCPFCGAAEVRLESSFGPTRCRMIWWCEDCKNSFEHLKRVSLKMTN